MLASERIFRPSTNTSGCDIIIVPNGTFAVGGDGVDRLLFDGWSVVSILVAREMVSVYLISARRSTIPRSHKNLPKEQKD